MERMIRCVLLAGAVACVFSMNATSQATETYITAQQAKVKFGGQAFDAEKFKQGDRKLKGEMAADLILKKAFIGKSLQVVQALLGAPDGFFENKGIPAYIISPDVTKGDTWQIVFFPDKDWKKVDEVKIHKNCCD